jgi:hypothetical protein
LQAKTNHVTSDKADTFETAVGPRVLIFSLLLRVAVPSGMLILID